MIVGGLITRVIFGSTGVSFIGSVLCAALILIAYRRYVQKRLHPAVDVDSLQGEAAQLVVAQPGREEGEDNRVIAEVERIVQVVP